MSDRDPAERLNELEELVGRTVAGKYQVTRLIGRGGMGAVYEAENIGIGKKGALKIVDLGISKIERAQSGTAPLVLTHKGLVMGTPLYMSPEQAQAFSDVDGRADLYSLGAILFECIAGRPPHAGNGFEQVLLAICMTDAPDVRAIVPSVPDEVAEFLARALARDRRRRFASAAQMLNALHAIAPIERTRVPLEE